MHSGADASRFLKLLVAAFLLLCGVVAAFNALVDPYAIFGTPRIEGFNAHKPRAAERVRVAKAYMAEAVAAHTIVGGNSRPEIGIDPESPCWDPAHLPAFNAGVPGAGVNLQTAYIRHAIVASGARRVLLGIDFVDFLVPIAGQYDRIDWSRPLRQDELRLKHLGDSEYDFASLLHRTKDRFNGLFSLETLADAIVTVVAQHRPDVSTRRPDGFNPAQDYLPIIRNEGQAVLFAQKNRELARLMNRTDLGLYNVGSRSSGPLQALDRFLQWAGERDIEVDLFINPYHAHYLAMIELAGRWPELERWKRDILAIAAAHNTPLWDFNAFDTPAIQPPPPEHERGKALDGYWEPAHYRKELGDHMLARIERTQCPAADLGATPGVELRMDTIEPHQQALRLALAQYAWTHAAEYQVLAKLLHDQPRQE